MTKYQEAKFIDYVERLCDLSEDMLTPVGHEEKARMIRDRIKIKTSFIKWFSKQIKS